MNCACGQARPEGAKFCPECGAAFAPRCASCGADLTPAAKFCAECGAATKGVGGADRERPSQPSPEPRTPNPISARKVVTILFADLAGSTALHEGLDPESVNAFMERYYLAMRGAAEAHGGTVVKFLGDGVMVAFGVPRVAEDDAMRAVRAGVAMQQAFEDLARQASAAIGLRVAINTGEVIVNPDNTDVLGDPVNVAARLQQEARDGHVVLGESTQRLVSALVTLAPLGSVTLKGRAEAVKAYRVESLERPAGVIAAPFVGRAAEMARLEAAYATAVEKPATGLAVLLGSPGLGKSRLIDELQRRLGESTTMLTAYCDAAGGATFAPIAAALRAWLGDRSDQSDPTDPSDQQPAIAAALPADAPDRARIIAGITALLAGSPASPEETFFVVRRMLAALAQAKPVVLVIDDLHWAEPLLLDLVEHLVQWGSGVPLLVLVGARPELRDVRSSLVTPGGLVGDVLTLAGLDAGAAMRLAANVIGAEDLPAAVAAKVLATSEGNPLFVGELVRMLVQEGALTKEGDRWIPGVALAALEMPPTIHALLAARIERLRPEERSVLERAAVVGRHFSRSAVAELMSRDVVDLDARIEALRRSELIEPDSGWFLGEPMLRFHHVLIRDAAYRRLLKGTRADLHGRVADWVAARAGDADHDETIGWHLEQAHQLLRELGPLDTAGRALGERASQHLAAAGRRALARDDLPVAADLLGRAIDRLDVDDAARADLALDWCEALLSAGDVATAVAAIEELGRFAREDLKDRKDSSDGALSEAVDTSHQPPATSHRLRAWHTCFVAQLTVLTAPQGLQAAADSVAAAAQQLAALGDAGGEAKAHSVHATALARLGKVGACEAALDQALAAARRGGDRRRANAVLAGAPLAALWGPSPVTRASGRCLDVVRVLRITQGAPAVESVALSCQGVLEALRGRTEAARRMLASARKMVEDLGIAHRLFEADVFAGRIASMEGDTATAERLLRGAYDGLRDLGLGIDAARAGALLGRALLAQDRSAEAEALSYESEALAGDDLQAAIAWRGVRAEALAKRGEHTAAIELAKAAVAIASATDALLDHADARVALAVALRAAGRGAEADAEERRAFELWEAKGATLLVERARTKSRPVKPTTVNPMPQPGSAHAESARSSRRVRPNTATAMVARLVAAVAARDFDGITRETPEDFESIDHPSGSSYGREAVVASLRRLFRSRDPHYDVEPLATLGELLVLGRRRTCASGTEGSRYDVGPYENEAFELFEANTDGKSTRTEVFAADHLGDATTRLYQRYAEILPEGPERQRAAATARTLDAMLMSPDDVDRVATVIAPDFESVDHRHLSTWSMRGGSAFIDHLHALAAVATDIVIRVDDVLALGPNALLTQRLHSGTERVGGGADERPFLVLFATDTDGRLARAEWFDADREAEALARFDALAAGTAVEPPVRRRVRPNAATAMHVRFDLALAARDFDGVAAVFDASHEEIDHPTGSTYGRDAGIASLQRLFRSRDPYYQVEPLATLGELLLLGRRRSGASGATRGNYDVGAYENEAIQLFEVNEAGLCCRAEVFAAERLSEAITRLYERYAELLPDGPERICAAATARSVAVWNGPIDPERLATAMASSVENADHRRFGTWSARGPEDYLRHWRLQDELAAGWALRDDAVLALEPNAFLVRRAYFGTVRSTGGAFENLMLALFVFGSDGLTTRTEIWEPACETEALARFEEIACGAETEAQSEPFANAATRAVDRGTAALAARDWEGFAALFAAGARHFDRTRVELFEIEALDRALARFEELRADAPQRFANAATTMVAPVIAHIVAHDWQGFEQLFAASFRMSDRRRLVQLDLDRDQYVAFTREIADGRAIRAHSEIIATRGERLALTRSTFEFTDEDVGPSEVAFLLLTQVDARGRIVAYVRWDLEDLGAARDELDARWAAHGAAEHPHAAKWLAGYLHAFAVRDWTAMTALFTPDLVGENHRLVGWGTRHGPEGVVSTLQAQIDLAPDTLERVDHVRTCDGAVLVEYAWHGTLEGGAFENLWLVLVELAGDGRAGRADVWEPEQLDQARAGFAEIAARDASAASAFTRTEELRPDPLRIPPNAATRAQNRQKALAEAGEWEAVRALHSPRLVFDDRRPGLRTTTDGDAYLAGLRWAGRPELTHTVLATAGDRLELRHNRFSRTEDETLVFEIETLALAELDADGLLAAIVLFDPAERAAAEAELFERYVAGGGDGMPRGMTEYFRGVNEGDLARARTGLCDDFVLEDRRRTGMGRLEGSDAYIASVAVAHALTGGVHVRLLYTAAIAAHGRVVMIRAAGTNTEGGAFETYCAALVLYRDERIASFEFFEPEELDAALARLAACGA